MIYPTWPRWFVRVFAFFAGYFWAPCPVCGKGFAGFESAGIGLPNGLIVCGRTPACGRAAESLWRQRMSTWVYEVRGGVMGLNTSGSGAMPQVPSPSQSTEETEGSRGEPA